MTSLGASLLALLFWPFTFCNHTDMQTKKLQKTKEIKCFGLNLGDY